MGFERTYIQRAFKVYEVLIVTFTSRWTANPQSFTLQLLFKQKNYGHAYNVEVITEIIVRLQNKDKTKEKNIKDQSSSPKKRKQRIRATETQSENAIGTMCT